FFSSRRRHTRVSRDWSSDVCSSDLPMLKQRVIAAVILLAILLPALFWRTPGPFLAVTLILIAAGGWEWGKLNGLGQGASLVLGEIGRASCRDGGMVAASAVTYCKKQ